MQIGSLRSRVTLANPSAPIPDGDGGSIVTWTTLASRVAAAVEPASARVRAYEMLLAKTTEAVATHVVTVRYVAGVTTKTRVTFHDGAHDRQLYVTGFHDVDERHAALAMACNEVLP